jgi:hypothetical protein
VEEGKQSKNKGKGADEEGPDKLILYRYLVDTYTIKIALLWIRIRWIRMFWGLPDPDPSLFYADPDPDPSINKQKK